MTSPARVLKDVVMLLRMSFKKKRRHLRPITCDRRTPSCNHLTMSHHHVHTSSDHITIGHKIMSPHRSSHRITLSYHGIPKPYHHVTMSYHEIRISYHQITTYRHPKSLDRLITFANPKIIPPSHHMILSYHHIILSYHHTIPLIVTCGHTQLSSVHFLCTNLHMCCAQVFAQGLGWCKDAVEARGNGGGNLWSFVVRGGGDDLGGGGDRVRDDHGPFDGLDLVAGAQCDVGG